MDTWAFCRSKASLPRTHAVWPSPQRRCWRPCRPGPELPNQPIKLIVPWPAGGGVDTSARIIVGAAGAAPRPADRHRKQAGRRRQHRHGARGPGKARRLHPLMGSLSPNAVNPHLYTSLGFDPVKDFAPSPACIRCRASSWCRPTRLPRQRRSSSRSPRRTRASSTWARAASDPRSTVRRDVQERPPRSTSCTSPTRARARPKRRWWPARSTSCSTRRLPAVRRRRASSRRWPWPRRRATRPAQRADPGRAGRPRRVHLDVLRRHGAGRHAEGDRRPAEPEINAILQTDDMKARLAKLAPSPARHAGGLREVRARRDRALRRDRQALGRQEGRLKAHPDADRLRRDA